jgi:RimJ/RimL family protein N-acetyltransferase
LPECLARGRLPSVEAPGKGDGRFLITLDGDGFKLIEHKKDDKIYKRLLQDYKDDIKPFMPDPKEIKKHYPNDKLIEFFLFKTTGTDYKDVIGCFTIYSIKKDECRIGCFIKPDFRRNYYATKAHNRLFEFIKSKLKINKVVVEVLSTNNKSISMFEKLGFVRDRDAKIMECQGQHSLFYQFAKDM